MIHWYTGLSLAMVATHALLAGLLLSAMEAAGWIDWGHEGLLLAAVPILGGPATRWVAQAEQVG